MLKILRHKSVSKIIFWALVILIMPAFVMWGTGSLGRGSGPKFVGTIDNRKISFEDFYNSLTGVRAQIILNYFDNPKTLEAFLKNRKLLGKVAWDRLILLREVKKRKIKVADSEVIDYIKNTNPIFRRDGQFDEMVYEYVLRNNMNLDPRTFEEIVRQNLAIQRMNEAISKDLTITEREVLEKFKKDTERFKIAYIYFAASDFSGKAPVDESKIREYYERHKSELIIPVKDGEGNEELRAASFEESKGDIGRALAEIEEFKLASKTAAENHGKISELISKGASFNDAASQLGLGAPVETGFFSKSDYLEGLGEGDRVAGEAARIKTGELAAPVDMRKGTIIFRLVDTQPYDVEAFEKEKGEFTKKALSDKKTKFVEDWLRKLESETTLNINLDEYQKYYR